MWIVEHTYDSQLHSGIVACRNDRVNHLDVKICSNDRDRYFNKKRNIQLSFMNVSIFVTTENSLIHNDMQVCQNHYQLNLLSYENPHHLDVRIPSDDQYHFYK
jgi:hypothetical protein